MTDVSQSGQLERLGERLSGAADAQQALLDERLVGALPAVIENGALSPALLRDARVPAGVGQLVLAKAVPDLMGSLANAVIQHEQDGDLAGAVSAYERSEAVRAASLDVLSYARNCLYDEAKPELLTNDEDVVTREARLDGQLLLTGGTLADFAEGLTMALETEFSKDFDAETFKAEIVAPAALLVRSDVQPATAISLAQFAKANPGQVAIDDLARLVKHADVADDGDVDKLLDLIVMTGFDLPEVRKLTADGLAEVDTDELYAPEDAADLEAEADRLLAANGLASVESEEAVVEAEEADDDEDLLEDDDLSDDEFLDLENEE